MRIVRILNTYGPRINPYDGRGFSNFIVQALPGHDQNLLVRHTNELVPVPHHADELAEGPRPVDIVLYICSVLSFCTQICTHSTLKQGFNRQG